MLAAHAIENPADVSVLSSRNIGQRAVRKFAAAIPWNNAGAHSVGLMLRMLAREVLRICGTISHEHPWEVMPDLYFYRDPEEIEKEE